MNNKGILRVKLLAIIIILGIIIFALVPKGMSYLSNIKKDKYIEIAKEYIREIKDNINSLEYKQIPRENEALLVKLSSLKNKKRSPYGSFKNDYSYVIVLNRNTYYEYFFASIDSSGHGIPLVSEKSLNRESVVYGEDELNIINSANKLENLYIAGTIFTKNEDSKIDDHNILLTPVSGELTVPYDFKKEVHNIYDIVVKNIDTSIYNKEVTVNSGIVRYNNKILTSSTKNDLNGIMKYLSFPNNNKSEHYASFVINNNSYVAGAINKSSEFSNKNMIFDSVPTIVINNTSETIIDNDNKYLMWNLMSLYPNNSNYTITECGALIYKIKDNKEVNITLDTERVMIGKSNNNCELGNIFAIRKDNVKTGDSFIARGYIKYLDKNGTLHIGYSRDIVSGIVN